MTNAIDPGTNECEPGTLSGSIYAVLSSQVAPEALDSVKICLKRIAFGTASGLVSGLVEAIADTKFLQISAGGLVGGDPNIGPPEPHAVSHQALGTDPIKLDDLAPPDDTTDLDASTLFHGLLPKLTGDSRDVLGGDGVWRRSLESKAAYAEGVIENDMDILGGVAFTAFETPDIPEGFSGCIRYEFGVATGTDLLPIAGCNVGGRALLRRATGGALSISDPGADALAQGATYSYEVAANGNAFRVQLTIGTTATARVRGWWRIYGSPL